MAFSSDKQRRAAFAHMSRPQASSIGVPFNHDKIAMENSKQNKNNDFIGLNRDGSEQRVTKKDIHKANVDDAQASEIKIFMENDGDLYRQQTMPIAKDLQKKFDKGSYDKDKATKAWYNSVTSWERTHRADVGTANKDTRMQVASDLEREYRTEFESGNRF